MANQVNVLIEKIDKAKNIKQKLADAIFVSIRFAFPDLFVERIGLTSLRVERFHHVLKHMEGKCLDIGCHDNILLRVYKEMHKSSNYVQKSIGVDTHKWTDGQMKGIEIIESAGNLPFEDCSFDTVSIIASLNHIPNRIDAVKEAYRVLKPNGVLIITMISQIVGNISHRVRFWGEHSHRDMHEEEQFGMNTNEVISILNICNFSDIKQEKFLYGLNSVYVARK